MKMKKMKTYTELSELRTFKERYEYCKTAQIIGDETFGGSRYLNQIFYSTKEWKSVRDRVIIRDNGCELGMKDYPINGKIIVHHLNAITKEMILNRDELLFDENNLVCCSLGVHNAIHYGDERYIPFEIVERRLNDTCPWRK